MSMQETWISVRMAGHNVYDHARLEVRSVYYAYRDSDNPDAEIRINADAVWRVYPDGREEDLSPEVGEAWLRRLRTDNRRAARNRRRGEF